MARAERNGFEALSELRELEKSRTELVDVAGRTIARITYEPGWRWLEHSATPGENCFLHHVGLTLQGQLGVRTGEGIETVIGPGDVYDIPPDHHGWVVGEEPWVAVDFEGFRNPQ